MSKEKITNEEEVKDLTKHLKDYKHQFKMYIRILAVRMVKLGETRTNTGEYLHVTDKLWENGSKSMILKELKD